MKENLFGVEIYPDANMVTRMEQRVRGGYLNRWLIREVVVQPLRCVQARLGVLYAHPAVIVEMRAVVARQMGLL